jgi:hypothetical protein
MNSKLCYLYFVLFLTLASCNQKDASTITSKENFTVIIEGIFGKNDKLQVFYLTKDSDWNDENSIVMPVYASSEMQKIEVVFPEKIYPLNLRVDVGENKFQSNLTIKNISVCYKTKTINGNNGIFTDYFYPNEFISWDPEYYGYKLSSIGNAYDPFFMGNDLLISKLEYISNQSQK